MSQTKINKRDMLSFAKPYGYIYKIENLINRKRYIGQTTNKKGVRGSMTLSSLNNCYKYNPHFINSIKLYRFENFERKIIDSGKNKEELDKKEIFYIQKFGTLNPNYGYNIRCGGSNGKLSKETKRKLSLKIPWNDGLTKETDKRVMKISNSLKGHSLSNETKKRISDAHKGKIISKETREKQRENMKGEKNHMWGKHHSEETKRKIGITSKGRKHSEETKRKRVESMKDYKHSEETKKKISESHKGIIPWNKGMNKKQMKQYRKKRGLR